jgi:hypothetical protein
LYPEIGRELLDGHHNIAALFGGTALMNTTCHELLKKSLFLANEGNDKLLFSSENFMRLTEEDLKALRLCFRDYDFHALYFQRRDPRFFFSLWHSMVMHGRTHSLDKLNLSALERFYKYNPFAHEDNILKLKNGLGGEVTVFDYVDLRSRGIDILGATCSILNVALNSRQKTVNPSLPIESIELIRAANLYSNSLGLPPTSHPRQYCLSILRSLAGRRLKRYIEEKMAVVSKRLPVNHLIRAGFPVSDVKKGDASQEFKYVPGRLLLNELEKDDLAAWKSVKMQIEKNSDSIRAKKNVQNPL